MSDPSDKVISLAERLKKRGDFAMPVRRSPRNFNACEHQRHCIVVDLEARVVNCEGCGVQVDPIEALYWLCDKTDDFIRVESALREAGERLEALFTEEQRLKARIRNARKRLTATPRRDEEGELDR